MDGVIPLRSPPAAAALDRILAPPRAEVQPPLYDQKPSQLTAAIATLALGGAERIVLDWAAGCAACYPVRLIVLRRAPAEWPVPPGITVTLLDSTDPLQALTAAGAEIAAAGNPLVLCHLLTAAERAALARGGALAIPVLHNAAAGWNDDARALAKEPRVIAVSHAAANDLRDAGSRAACTVIHHVPSTPRVHPQARSQWRERWAVPQNALVIGMVGAVKPQKAYTHALRLLAQILERHDVWLVIVGGPVGRDGDAAWNALLAQARRLQLEPRLRLPGFIANAAGCLPAFDLLLNTSRYEGLSIATLEALAAGLPVVASAVGGQGEITAPGLRLIGEADADTTWLRAIEASLTVRPPPPAWRGFPSHRLWTLLHLLPRLDPVPGVLFVTANLNAGGAQRSLCNLTRNLNRSLRLEIVVCGDSSTAHFYLQLQAAGVMVRRSAASRDCFDHAEAIVQRVVSGRFGAVCFWNTDSKVKLLLVKTLATSRVRLVDVSPGGYSFEEMQALREFQQWIAFDENAYYARLDRLVLKYQGSAPTAAQRRKTVIPNGVPAPALCFDKAATNPPKIVVSGRIAPSKFIVEIVDSMRLLWQTHPATELHLLGHSEQRHADYAGTVISAIGAELNQRVFLHGAVFDAPDQLGQYRLALVLGEHQGSPNAVLEAMAAAVPVVANDSGGTRELVVHERTGLLIQGRDPRDIACTLKRLLDDIALARRLAVAGQRHVTRQFSMAQMVRAYRKLLVSC
jgi:glycosyltransferase involved in cell wall biosynthesis